MELNHQIVTAPPRAAASVLLLRDAPGGLEIFMVKRHGASDVLGGAYVFPGGKVDTADREEVCIGCLEEAPGALHHKLAEPELEPAVAAATFFAACRETFEESGILLAPRAGGAEQREAMTLARGGRPFAEICRHLGLTIAASRLVPWSRWITPVVPSVQTKRFDTRFFAGTVPAGQHAEHDNREASDSAWWSPRDALDRYWAHEIELAPPQIMTLAHLSRHASVASALSEGVSRPPPVIQPEPTQVDGKRVVCYPGDPGHPLTHRAMPGPTRLVFRNKRFEPVDGFEALFV